MRFRVPVETKVVKCKFKDQKDTGTIQGEDTQEPTLLLIKTKVIKSKFEDQKDTGTMQDEDADAATDAVTPATQPPTSHGGAAAAAGRVEPPPAPSTASGQHRGW